MPLRYLLTLLLLLVGAPAQSQVKPESFGERILSYSSDITIARDGELAVTETIRVRSLGIDIRRGIYRDFPTRYQRDGRTVRVGFEVDEVRRNGEPEKWATESIDNGTRVRIGSEDVLLPSGEHVYTIRYRTTRQLGFFENYDELYWNVPGNGWQFPIDQVVATVRLPAPAEFGDRAIYTGPQGSKASDGEVVAEEAALIRFQSTRPLGPQEGMTIAVAWPKGIVDPPLPPTVQQVWLADHGALVAAGVAIAGLCFFYFHAWKQAGRGPAAGTIVPLFAPPSGMSAAEARYVRRMGYDSRVFAAALVEAGGFFGKDRTYIEKTGEPGDLPRPERDMLWALFAGGDRLEMDNKHHALFSAAQKRLRQNLETAHLGQTFLTNRGWAVVGLMLLMIAIALIGAVLIVSDPYSGPGASLGSWLAIGCLTLGLGLGMKSRLVRKEGSLLSAIFAVILAIGGLFALVATIPIIVDIGRPWILALPLLTLPLVISAFWWMAAPTRHGRKLMDEIAGFERYLSVTEEDRLERLHPPEKTPELFERFLPYAIALDVENEWAEGFADVLAAAAQRPDEGRPMRWYSGHHNVWSNPGRFVAAVGGSLASTASSASTAPGSSSGSGGGGSSGGGGGGGGGGGW